MPLIETVGTLTIPAGSKVSNALSQSAFGRYDALGIFAPAGYTGSATLLASPVASASAASWSLALTSTGTVITFPSSSVSFLESFPYEMIMLSGSLPAPATGSAVTYIVKGQIMGALTGLAALNPE